MTLTEVLDLCGYCTRSDERRKLSCIPRYHIFDRYVTLRNGYIVYTVESSAPPPGGPRRLLSGARPGQFASDITSDICMGCVLVVGSSTKAVWRLRYRHFHDRSDPGFRLKSQVRPQKWIRRHRRHTIPTRATATFLVSICMYGPCARCVHTEIPYFRSLRNVT